MNRNGILCIEGDWEDGLVRRRSLVPVLQLLKSQWNVPFIHRTASTREEFRVAILEWLKAKYAAYPILYLGYHGQPGALEIGGEEIPISDIAELFGKGKGRVIHFGACETMSAPAKALNHFLRKSKFTAICGFKADVDWLHSCALEIIILDGLSKRQITPKNVRIFQVELQRLAGSLAKELGFKVWDRSHLNP